MGRRWADFQFRVEAGSHPAGPEEEFAAEFHLPGYSSDSYRMVFWSVRRAESVRQLCRIDEIRFLMAPTPSGAISICPFGQRLVDSPQLSRRHSRNEDRRIRRSHATTSINPCSIHRQSTPL